MCSPHLTSYPNEYSWYLNFADGDYIPQTMVSFIIKFDGGYLQMMQNRHMFSNTYHYDDVTTCVMASEITGVSIVCSTVRSGADLRKHQSSTWLVRVRGIHRWPVDSPHKWLVTPKMFPFGDIIMQTILPICHGHIINELYKNTFIYILLISRGVGCQLWAINRLRCRVEVTTDGQTITC